MTAAGEALLPASMIAAGALTVFMYFDTIFAADDLRQLVDAGPPAVAKARQFILQATQELQGGNGPARQQMAQKLSKETSGAPSRRRCSPARSRRTSRPISSRR